MQNDKKLLIAGNSFGGLIALQLAKAIQPDGVFLLMPVCDVRSQVDHLNSNAAGWSRRTPYRRLLEANLENSESCNSAVEGETPMFVILGADDQNVGETSQLALDRALAARGSLIVKRPGSEGHNIDLAYLNTMVVEADRWFSAKTAR